MQFLRHLFLPDNFMPHGYCYLWAPGLIWLHAVSDSAIALSYMTIPVTLVHFTRKRRDVPFSWIFVCFGVFIVACGMTHLLEVYSIWVPAYWLAGGVKALTAAASVGTAILLIRVTPRALALPGTTWLLDLNRKLSAEVEQRVRAENEYRSISEDLERRVAERTAELEAANQMLRESQLRYRALVEHAPEAIVVFGLETGAFLDLNTKAEQLFGMSRAELLRVGPLEVSPPVQPDGRRSSEAAMEQIRLAIEGGTPPFEWTHRNAAGLDIPCEVSFVRLPSSTHTLIRGSVVDITARKHAEEQIRTLNAELEHRVAQRTSELETANRDLESFTYSVSHDLRAPLRQVNGFSKILIEDFGPQLSSEARHHLERVRSATVHMGHLVDDLLNLARIGRRPLALRRTDLNALVEEVVETLQSDPRDRGVEWCIGLLSLVECDPGLMRQVFANLLANAVKFSRPCEHPRIYIGEIPGEFGPIFFVRDNGVGFDLRYADKLFSVFHRLHRDDEFEGTGVGLAIVHRILQKHGGAIWAESSPQKGAAFYFSVNDSRARPKVPAAGLRGDA